MISKQPKTVVFYHKNCQDGFMSALVHKVFVKANRLNPSDFEYVALQYEDEIKVDVTDCVVYMLDVTVKPDLLDMLVQKAQKVVVLDHHESAMNDYHKALSEANSNTGDNGSYGRLKVFTGCQCSSDQHQVLFHNHGFHAIFSKAILSGATLAFREFKISDKALSKRMQYLCTRITDRDLWKFEFKYTKAVYEVVSGFQFDFEKAVDFVFNVSDDDFETTIKEGAVRVKMRDELAAGYASKAETLNVLGYDVPCVNVPANFASYVGAILSVGKPFALMYVLNSTEVFLSFRSNKDTGIDVIPIAKQFGGGGHKNAAGARLSTDDFFKLIFKK